MTSSRKHRERFCGRGEKPGGSSDMFGDPPGGLRSQQPFSPSITMPIVSSFCLDMTGPPRDLAAIQELLARGLERQVACAWGDYWLDLTVLYPDLDRGTDQWFVGLDVAPGITTGMTVTRPAPASTPSSDDLSMVGRCGARENRNGCRPSTSSSASPGSNPESASKSGERPTTSWSSAGPSKAVRRRPSFTDAILATIWIGSIGTSRTATIWTCRWWRSSTSAHPRATWRLCPREQSLTFPTNGGRAAGLA